MLRADIFRALVLVGLSIALIWFYLNNRIKSSVVVAAIGILTLLDIWSVAKRVLPASKFETPQEATADLQPQLGDKIVMNDTDPNFRVLDLRNGLPFTNAQTSMFHKSVGGYHAAKLMIYQEMIENHLSNFEKGVPILEQKHIPLYGMLNAKYILLSDDSTGVLRNPMALGNAWFVKNVQFVDNADAEMAAIGKINPKDEVVIQKKFQDIIGTPPPQYDSTASIKMTSYNPDKLEYEYTAIGDQVVVFSEIYYPMEKGWNITIDGQPAKFVKANYILRAAKVPSGTHKIVMTFAPKSYYTGETVSMIVSSALLILLASGMFFYFRRNGLPDVDKLPTEDVAMVEKPKTIAPKPTPTLRKKK